MLFLSKYLPPPLFALAASSQPYPMRFQESLTTLLPSCLCCSSSSFPSSKNQLFREMQFLRGFEPLYKVITCGKGGRVQFFPMGAGSRRHLKFIHPRWNDEEGEKKDPFEVLEVLSAKPVQNMGSKLGKKVVLEMEKFPTISSAVRYKAKKNNR